MNDAACGIQIANFVLTLQIALRAKLAQALLRHSFYSNQRVMRAAKCGCWVLRARTWGNRHCVRGLTTRIAFWTLIADLTSIKRRQIKMVLLPSLNFFSVKKNMIYHPEQSRLCLSSAIQKPFLTLCQYWHKIIKAEGGWLPAWAYSARVGAKQLPSDANHRRRGQRDKAARWK